ncbi:hypothetical protein [Longitalea arenae]|uniref:hypothetical protein n=1 Tax=Longitalea arenae TaxID=2812558 RepID=UPI0019681D94|nr:hypothetical protein [Longitalea arenae]
MSNLKTAFAKSKYLELSEHGSRLNLSFTSHLVIGNTIVGLDGIKNCLFVLDTGDALKRSFVIDLNKVHAISLTRTYRNINHEELKNSSIDQFLEKVALEFDFKDKSNRVVLPFYDCYTDRETDRQQLEKIAENWQKVLCKMIGSR